MRVDLRELVKHPNPYRDFIVDPIDDAVVAVLCTSISELDFWGGVTARMLDDGTLQTVSGHHRIRGALKAGINHAEIFVGDYSDDDVVRLYARENATHRGINTTATAGSVAAAIRILTHKDFNGLGIVREITDNSKPGRGRGRGRSVKGIDSRRIAEFLGCDSLRPNIVEEQKANLSVSGDIDRITNEVIEQVEAERTAALKQAEKERREAEDRVRQAEIARQKAEAQEQAARDEKERRAAEEALRTAEEEIDDAGDALATAKAAEGELANNKVTKTKVTVESHFDFSGVTRYLTVSSHVTKFRKLVTGKALRDLLPVSEQANLAKHLVDEATRTNRELTAGYIHSEINGQLAELRVNQKKKAEQDRLLRQDWEAKAKKLQGAFSRNCRSMLSAVMELVDHDKKRPKGVTFFVTGEFRTAIENAEKALSLIRKELKI